MSIVTKHIFATETATMPITPIIEPIAFQSFPPVLYTEIYDLMI
jgi:hypothetical protein